MKIGAGDVAEIFEQDGAGHDFAAFERPQLAPRDDLGLRFHRHQQDDVVVDVGVDLAPPQPEPIGDLEVLSVFSPAVEAHLAKIVQRLPDFDSQDRPAPMQIADFVVGQFDKVRTLEHLVERLHEVGV